MVLTRVKEPIFLYWHKIIVIYYCLLNEGKTVSDIDTAVVRSLYMKRKSHVGGKIGPEKRVTNHHHYQPLPLLPHSLHTHTPMVCAYTCIHTHIHLSRWRRFRNTQRATTSNGLARAENHFSHTFSFFSAT